MIVNVTKKIDLNISQLKTGTTPYIDNYVLCITSQTVYFCTIVFSWFLLKFCCCFKLDLPLHVFVTLRFWWSVAFSDIISTSKWLRKLDTTSHSNLYASGKSCAKFHTLFIKWKNWWKLCSQEFYGQSVS